MAIIAGNWQNRGHSRPPPDWLAFVVIRLFPIKGCCMRLIRPLLSGAVLTAFAFCLPGMITAQEEKPKTVPATKIKPSEAKEKEEKEEEKDDEPNLDIGAKAPKLTLTDWVKGKEIEEFKSGQIYVVEFWATWCGPCKLSMPHLAELQTKYGDKVKMIGISDEETEKVKEFLTEDQSEGKTWDKVVTYSLAMDDDRKTNSAYMEAAGENGIPTAFIIGKDGVIEWIGHPMVGLDKALDDVLSGKHDRAIAKTERVEAKAAQIALMKAGQKINKAMQAGKIDEAVKVIDEILESQPKTIGQIGMIKLQIMAQGEDKKAAEKYADELVDKLGDNAMALNNIAWGIAADQNLPGTLDTALKAALKGVKATEEKEAMILDTLARVYFEMGKLDDAIAWQKKAVALSKDEQITDALEKYEKAKAEKKEEKK